MPLSILDYVRSKVGEKDIYTAEDFLASGVDIVGGCECCPATIAAYNAYPARSGYWRCADCIDDAGFASAEEFEQFEYARAACPACGSDTISEPAEEHFACGACGAEWTP